MENKNDNNLPGILILSHGALCEGLLGSAKMIYGDFDGVKAMPFYDGSDIRAYGEDVMRLYGEMPEGSIILFDLFCGTPFNQVLERCARKKIFGLCGVNLSILLEALNLRESMRGQELIEALAETGRESLVDVKSFFEFN
ncbi:MAG: PTS sugar transporter subunit IIA [Lachnospiraceae bacterium]|nr:PTS sugar transporter subunit IIA [Lachnospiraceae bacterium]